MASVAVQSKSNMEGSAQKGDEINRFVNSQFVTACEAFWRICGFDVHGRDPSVE